MTLTSAIPRLDCLGLIEASCRVASDPPASEIPRLDCLGLIEAVEVELVLERDQTGFRGLIASASLKLWSPTATVSRGFGIPRLDCLGLIEACVLAESLTSISADSEA